jgi:hypothetical protein
LGHNSPDHRLDDEFAHQDGERAAHFCRAAVLMEEPKGAQVLAPQGFCAVGPGAAAPDVGHTAIWNDRNTIPRAGGAETKIDIFGPEQALIQFPHLGR